MYKNPQNICGLCQKLLCCVQCKRKHQLEQHPDSDYNPECPLCNNGSMVRYPNPDNDLVAHIKQHHLPLGCIKCAVIVEHGEDFLKLDGSCLLVPVALPAPTIEITHPDVEKSQNFKETKETTPKSKFNLKGPNSLAKCASTSFLSTQVTTTRLVRTCSTPTTQEMVSIQFMNGTHSSQMSSICNQSSEITSNSPGVFALGGTPMAPKVDKFKIPAQQKLRFKGSNVTPLRQVMSQNVQRALLNHDLMTQRSPQPLDLRTKRRSFGGSFENEDIPEVQEVGPEDSPEHKCEKTKEVVVSSTECVVPIGSESGEKEDQIVNSHLESTLDDSDDIFYSPVPLRSRRRRRSSIYTCVRLEEYSEEFSSDLVTATTREFTATYDEVSADPLPVAVTQQPENKVSLWNVLSSVLRFASGSLMPRAVSNGHGGLEDSEESVNIVSKRRTPSSPGPAQSPRQSPKRTRFQGRRPIARCRELSDK